VSGAIPMSQAAPTYRRLIVCFDGTENDGLATGQHLTNVGRLYSCITRHNTVNDVDQLQHYVQGLATATEKGDFREKALGASK
jgi:uncharacterized protein (DUF2235 family)